MRGRLVKGSAEAKRYMAYLRSLRRGGHRRRRDPYYDRRLARGGIAITPQQIGGVVEKSIRNWVDWGKAYKQERDAQISEIQQLESLEREHQKNPKMNGDDLMSSYQKWKSAQAPGVEQVGLNNGTFGNILRGPTGWIRLIGRTSRANKIKALKKRLGI